MTELSSELTARHAPNELLLAVAHGLRNGSFNLILRKEDADMSTIMERLAVLEAANAAQSAAIAALPHPTDGVASVVDVSALGTRVTAIEAEIGIEGWRSLLDIDLGRMNRVSTQGLGR